MQLILVDLILVSCSGIRSCFECGKSTVIAEAGQELQAGQEDVYFIKVVVKRTAPATFQCTVLT